MCTNTRNLFFNLIDYVIKQCAFLLVDYQGKGSSENYKEYQISLISQGEFKP